MSVSLPHKLCVVVIRRKDFVLCGKVLAVHTIGREVVETRWESTSENGDDFHKRDGLRQRLWKREANQVFDIEAGDCGIKTIYFSLVGDLVVDFVDMTESLFWRMGSAWMYQYMLCMSAHSSRQKHDSWDNTGRRAHQ